MIDVERLEEIKNEYIRITNLYGQGIHPQQVPTMAVRDAVVVNDVEFKGTPVSGDELTKGGLK